MENHEPNWLVWARELQALAQTGLTFTENTYDRERYERIRALSAEILHSHTGEPLERIATLFSEQTGYARPGFDSKGG